MEGNKIKLAVTVVSLVALSVLFTKVYRRRRKQKGTPGSCYLHTDPKPQHTFKRVLANNSYSPFKHLKRNDTNNETSSSLHPYEAEISTLIEKPSIDFNFIYDEVDLKMRDEYVWVETESQLKELADALSKEKVFAVDTEQHSLRSFLGFTALIQISSRKEDYLVDTIALHDVMQILRPVFADPCICKVFHGADNDVLWLQRDFHIYAVNLFDTAKACDVLSKPQRSLAYLLETYCEVATNKLLQLEDWRQRPLPPEMVEYARIDSHYLLYIAGCLNAELQQQDDESSSCPNDKLHFVYEASRRSNMICMQLYTKEIEASPGQSAASSIISRHFIGRGDISSVSFEMQELVRRLCTWRDLMARVHDESLRFVLSDHAVIALTDKVPTSPTEICSTIAQADMKVDSLSLTAAIPSPSPIVCSHLDDLSYLIQDKNDTLDDIFLMLLQNCLGPNGSCPLSVYSYALLVQRNLKLTNRFVPTQNGVKNSRQISRKASRDLFVQKFSCKSPVYHNCRIYANDGRLLCYCDRRKLEWYLRRDLAKLVDDNPPGIMLLFEPKGRPEDEDNDFYIQSKQNLCVGCGEEKHYLRYRIIPSCYRMHFPEHLKSHRSHDIVLLCVDCHEVAHAAAEKYKRQIAAEFGVPLFVPKVFNPEQGMLVSSASAMSFEGNGVSPLQLRTAAMALLRHGSRMPSKRCKELRQIVMQFYGGREISEDDLERALLVGMSPHERRRLEKKRGLSFKHAKGSSVSDKGQENGARRRAGSAVSNTSEFDDSNSIGAEPLGETDDRDNITMIGNVSSFNTCSNLEADEEVVGTVYRNIHSNNSETSDAKDVSVANAGCESRSLRNGADDFTYSSHDGSVPPKHNSKLSLLGHGPHGKQVVDHILKEYGEDGISQFCQRWRQVFVEAVHPRFLPAGWDVMHRRDFGEFSVYNPGKKDSAAAKSQDISAA
ncbi:protein RRP6-like 3 isoform X2 [Tripterygium wilfordii]|uniref:protein RRP6-like 3 isoform X2 n=1 Tax=Tripterygium wilfordii TaxID=458696 RepID=UPI0018F843D9|nr:protein RRP6-like 3 isoform X2 [Tripterygium wilfordii]